MTDRPVRHVMPSMLLSLDDEPWQPSQRLLGLAADLAATTPDIEHPTLNDRNGTGPRWYRQFPGEHYKLLTAICRLLKPGVVWEFGTDRGMSTVALLEGLHPDARLFTVDIDDWRSKTGPWLVADDFASGRVTQFVSDMKSPRLFADRRDSIAQAELIFVDGPKDGVTEEAFLHLLADVPFRHDPIIVFDDIRLMNMIRFWRSLDRPKMDITSFGHWSGTGLVDWSTPALPKTADAAPSHRADPTPTKIVKPAELPPPGSAARPDGTMRILMLCHPKPNYIPDLLLHGLRKLVDTDVVDYPRKDALYDGCLGQPYLDRIAGLMAPDTHIDRSEIRAKTASGFFDLVLCDVRAVEANRELLRDSRCRLALIDGEDRPAPLAPGNYVILRRETDGNDFSLPLPMAMPTELLDWIDRHADAPKTSSIGFLGSRSALTAERNAMLDELSRRFPDALITSWAVTSGQWEERDAYYAALQSCKVVLTLPGAGYDTFRYWENAACNAAHLARRMPLLIPNDFREGHEILRFSDIAELTGKVERIVSGGLDWRELAAQSRQRLRTHHTTERRAKATLDRLNAAFLR